MTGSVQLQKVHFSNTGKLGLIPSFNTSSKRCKVGNFLKLQDFSVCSKCYCDGGSHFTHEHTQDLLEINHELSELKNWVQIMTDSIYQLNTLRFRWFASGDIQSCEMLEKINQIAYNLPDIKFWLPTRELKVLEKFFIEKKNKKANNLSIILSENFFDDFSIKKGKKTFYKNHKGKMVDITKLLKFVKLASATNDPKIATCPVSQSKVKGNKKTCLELKCDRCFNFDDKGPIIYFNERKRKF